MVTVTASTKYWVVAGLTAVISVLTYFQGQTSITESTIIGAGILVVGLIVHDIENENVASAPAAAPATPTAALPMAGNIITMSGSTNHTITQTNTT